MSKLGLHIISWNHSQEILDFIGRAKPRVVKMMDFNEMNTDAARGSSPGTIFVGRQFLQNQPIDNPAGNAKYLFDSLQPAIQKMGRRIDVWEGYNEITINSVDDAKRYSDFTVYWAQLMHSQGLSCAAYSFSTANPELKYWPYLAEGAKACDYLALHEYDSPRMDTHVGDFCLRYRRVRSALPKDALRPILITECGIDDGANNGWVKYTSGNDYIAQLGWYDREMMKDDYIIGSTIFTIDGRDWQYFDLLPIMRPLADYIASQTPTPPPPGSPSISDATLSPASLNVGQLVNVSITVVNNSSRILQTQGPNSGFVYDEGDTFISRGFSEIMHSFRVGIDVDGNQGIDHPYRWGLGTSLAPGQSTTVTGSIRLNKVQSRYYWAGLVEEQIQWLQDRVGRKVVTVNPLPPGGGPPSISGVSFEPSIVTAGDLLKVKVTVVNNSASTLQTQGPDPGFAYAEGDTFRTRGFTEQSAVFRVGVDFDVSNAGIDHPYRWGLGAPLPPGQTVIVNGAIRLVDLQAKNYWAGLVNEKIAWLEDMKGTTQITVQAPPAPPPPTGGKVEVTSVSFMPVNVPQGQLLQLSATIVNNTNAILQTQGPDPGFVYIEGEDFWSRQYPPIAGALRIGVDFDGRTGIDHPYRWGLGVSLAPGQSTTVNGFLRLNRPRATRFWAGLIQEWVALLQDQQGPTNIIVHP